MEARGPGVGVGVFVRAVAGAKVERGNFVGAGGEGRRVVEEGTSGRKGGAGENGGKGEAERGCFQREQCEFERFLVIDVAFGVLDDEEDAERVLTS